MAQPSGGPMGGGMEGGMRGAPPGAGCMPSGPKSLEDMVPSDFVAQLHARLTEARPNFNLAREQAPRYDRLLADMKELSRHNERRFWRAVGRAEASVSVTSNLRQLLGSELREGEERVEAIKDALESVARLEEVLRADQRDKLTATVAEARQLAGAANAVPPMRRQ
jgi:hypothetical protein